MFGTILTRLWTQLGNKALLNIAELKLYPQEEHQQARSVQTRLKRTFGTALEEVSKISPPTNVGTSATTAHEDLECAPAADVFMAHVSPTPQASGSSAADSIDEQLGMQGIVQKLIDAVDTCNGHYNHMPDLGNVDDMAKEQLSERCITRLGSTGIKHHKA